MTSVNINCRLTRRCYNIASYVSFLSLLKNLTCELYCIYTDFYTFSQKLKISMKKKKSKTIKSHKKQTDEITTWKILYNNKFVQIKYVRFDFRVT